MSWFGPVSGANAKTYRGGKWSGGQPLLGYDVQNTKLLVNEVREIFDLYLREVDPKHWTKKGLVVAMG
jgi:site-specific DNA recombinase